jgi:hypothetical protein
LVAGAQVLPAAGSVLNPAPRGASMAVDKDVSPIECPNCASLSQGAFCSNCGTALTTPPLGVLSAVATDVFKVGEQLGYLRTYVKIARSPVKHTLALTDDPDFRTHGSFYGISAAIFLAAGGLFHGMSDNVMLISRMTESGKGLYDHIRDWFLAIQFFAVLTIFLPINYLLLRWLTKARVPAHRYVKFGCLSAGFILPILALSTATMSVLASGDPEKMSMYVLVSPLIYIAVLIAIVAFQVRASKRLWSTSMWGTIGLVVLSMIVSGVVSLLLGLAMVLLLNVTGPFFA